MNYDECFESGQLRKGYVGREELLNQIKIAESYLKKAKIVFSTEIYDISFLTAYISIFHSARALLYKKGCKERSHFCMFEFIKNEYLDNKVIVRFAEIGQHYRQTRSMVQYEGSVCSKGIATEAINDAERFLDEVKKIIK
ncbi:MAG: HEPN domain-containing protein [Candidatus Micrarchaeia archaeon]